jgi:uncharacterized delta-60 repeat protein
VVGADGRLDPGFGTGGKVLAKLGFASCGGQAVVRQPDGKLVVGGFVGDYPAVGTAFLLARYNANGTLDASFGNGGRVATSGGGETKVEDVVLLPDGKMIAVGYRLLPNPVQIRLVRYASNGSIDTTYGTAGKVTANLVGGSIPGRAVLLPDGKLLLVGSILNSVGPSYQGLVQRYNADGTLDMTFATGGQAIVDFPGMGEELRSLNVEADGRFYATGIASDQSIPTPDYEQDFLTVHFNADGSVDTAFGTNGFVTEEFGVEGSYAEQGLSAVLQPDGKLVTAGFSGYHGALARYNADGSLDTTFANGGKRIVDHTSAYELLLQPDGKLVMAGHRSRGAESEFIITRLHPDGRLDATFTPCALAHTSFGADANAQVWDALLQPDGKIVVVGWTEPSGGLAMARYGTAAPLGCQVVTSGRSSLGIRDRDGHERDRLKWTWKGSPASVSDFGDPTSSTGYTMCIVENAVASPTIRLGWPTYTGGWSSLPQGYEFEIGYETDFPFDKARLTASPSGRGKIKISASGEYLEPTLPLMMPLTVRLDRHDGGHCWEAPFSAAKTNTASDFKARSD